MYFSVLFDLPTGATIVCTFGLVLILMALARPVFARKTPGLILRPAFAEPARSGFSAPGQQA